MEVRQLARAAFGCSPTTASTVFSRVLGTFRPTTLPSAVALAIQRQSRRQISTTPVRFKDQDAPASPAAPSWPPSRPAQEAENKTAAAVPASKNSLQDMYPSDDPANWAMWSSDDFYRRHAIKKPDGPSLKLGPSIGRTVYVGGNVDQGRAFVLANLQARRNGVAVDWYRQRFYERRGMKVKRLRMDRRRRKFKSIFRSAVSRVQQLAKQGW